MNGFIKRTFAGLCLGAGLGVVAGCYHYREIVDPCWPERYNALARSSVREAFFNETANGHVLDQTVWDYYFVRDPKTGLPTDVLNAAGAEHLLYLSRRRPIPDVHLYLQTAQDIPYTGDPAKVIAARAELDQKRIMAVQSFMTAQLAPRGCTTPVEIAVFDPAEVGFDAAPLGGNLMPVRPLPIIGSYQKLQLNFQGQLPSPSGTGQGGAGGSGGAAGGSAVGGGATP